MDSRRGQRRHLVDRLRQRERLPLAHIAPEHPRERSESARMRMPVAPVRRPRTSRRRCRPSHTDARECGRDCPRSSRSRPCRRCRDSAGAARPPCRTGHAWLDAYVPSRAPSAALSLASTTLAIITLSQPPMSSILASVSCLMRGPTTNRRAARGMRRCCRRDSRRGRDSSIPSDTRCTDSDRTPRRSRGACRGTRANAVSSLFQLRGPCVLR